MPRKRSARLVLAVVLTAGLTLAASGCAQSVATPTAELAAAATPTPTPTPVVVTKAYTMADGSVVDVDPTQPLPANVLADITAPMQAETDALPTVRPEVVSGVRIPADPNYTAIANMARAAAAASKATGREFVVVFRSWASMTAFGPQEWLWQTTRDTKDQPATDDKAARVAQAQAFIAAQTDPGPQAWEIITME